MTSILVRLFWVGFWLMRHKKAVAAVVSALLSALFAHRGLAAPLEVLAVVLSGAAAAEYGKKAAITRAHKVE